MIQSPTMREGLALYYGAGHNSRTKKLCWNMSTIVLTYQKDSTGVFPVKNLNESVISNAGDVKGHHHERIASLQLPRRSSQSLELDLIDRTTAIFSRTGMSSQDSNTMISKSLLALKVNRTLKGNGFTNKPKRRKNFTTMR